MKIVITGATGFLGFNTARWLKNKGHEVTGLGRNLSRGERLKDVGVSFIPCTLAETSLYSPALSGADVVVHCAALSAPWGRPDVFHAANVQGTQHILDESRKQKVPRFIHISSPSIYFRFEDALDIDEATPIKPPFPSLYSATKFAAEEVVDAAGEDIFCVTLRPRGIFGPGDETLLPRLIRVAKKRGLPRLGEGKNIIDLTYVDNVSHAIELCLGSSEISRGQKYNITNGNPVELWPFLDNLFTRLELPISPKSLPYKRADFLARVLEWTYSTLPLKGEPALTRYTVGLLAKSQTLSLTKARRELGYEPLISMEEGLERAIAWLKENKT
jgi:nucleoside-diphosphate-sugar epimerase